MINTHHTDHQQNRTDMTDTRLTQTLIAALEAVGVSDAGAQLVADPAISFAALDVDSLGVIEIVARLENEFGVTLSDDDLDGVKRPCDLPVLFDGVKSGGR
jgi:acyl carrier protein